MKSFKKQYLPLLPLCLLLSFCVVNKSTTLNTMEKGTFVANLSNGDNKAFSNIKKAFVANNPGYDLHFVASTTSIPKAKENSIVFIQTGSGTATVNADKVSKFSVGDIIVLRKGESISTDSLFSSLIFTVPSAPPANIPAFVRPDWDENITDTPGGCATETNAYRRILLTWKDQVGPYLFHSLNAHRVRIMDSFSHYHPKIGGFDEFYLVQMVQPNARIITSNQVESIENPMSITKQQAKNLLQSTPLQVGDLLYLPRGVMHRGIGGVLAQVITVPGFISGSEIGVDHHLRKINERLGLDNADQLPYNITASESAVIK